MKLEIDFHGSEIADVKTGKNELEIIFSHAVIVQAGAAPVSVPATIKVGQPKYSKLPKKGRLTDGELYGVPGKALNGRIPVDLKCERECELSLSFEDKDYTIHGKSFHVIADLTKLPAPH
ncbi:MAG TPA: hypothetical protein VFO10_12945 [Oligoflexus sp.]|uniref:hypothetical protein n=1 Tax=Oligoflexus sp. TaxID=1971216 RepID=UPI002D7EA437|nr:hypothetical protein [Oligoflexus sp.]HET9238159.1 hypothetical protein [Oligoflexus sp.]